MGDVDFALAQVRDRDLVIESLREEKDTFEMERNMAEEAAAGFKEEVKSLREQLAAANEILPEVEAQAERERVRAETYMYERDDAEAKLAEEEVAHSETFEGFRRRLAEVEKELADSYKKNLRHAGVEDDLRTRLAEVEKERDRLKAANLTLADRITAAGFSMDRARELAEKLGPDLRAKWYPPHEAAERIDQIARILSGDEKGKCKYSGDE